MNELSDVEALLKLETADNLNTFELKIGTDRSESEIKLQQAKVDSITRRRNSPQTLRNSLSSEPKGVSTTNPAPTRYNAFDSSTCAADDFDQRAI